ncbi:MAG: TM2 domain-containing protein [bacterium]|nr:TM2 domain-containing protein [bacterium]
MKYCPNCGKELKEGADVCLHCGKAIKNSGIKQNGKSKILAGLLGIFFGYLGIHNFYLGYNSKGTTQLLLTVLSLGLLSFISAIWGLVEGVQILMGNITDADGNELVD